MDGQDDLAPAPVGGPPPPPPGPPGPPHVPVVEPLDDMGSIGAAVNAITNDKAPIISVLESMAARMDNLAMENRLTKQENLQLLTAARKAKVASTLAKLTNPMSVRAVTNNYKLQYMIEDILSTLKCNGQICVPVSLDRATAIIEAQDVLLEEIRFLHTLPSHIHNRLRVQQSVLTKDYLVYTTEG